MSVIENAIAMMLVGLIWGITNPFLEKGSSSYSEQITQEKDKSRMKIFYDVYQILLNYKFLIPFLLNQTGSILFYFTLGKAGKIVY
jgi:hypothetical protein